MLRQILSISILAASILSSLPATAKPRMAEKYTDAAGTTIQVIRDGKIVKGTVVKPLNGRSRVTAKKTKELKPDQFMGEEFFTPKPNPAPRGTGGSGTRVKPKQPIVYPGDRTPRFPTRR